jgi:hypothetical protein
MRELLDSVYQASLQYFKEHNIILPSYHFPKLNLAKYSPGGAMQYHTDFVQEKSHMPGFKFHTTCLFYLNDNYEGGEINFAILNEDKTEVLFHYEYKPKEGDLIIFPSGDPFFHGVNIVESGYKYIIRTY